jgi:hypothetical protein
VHATPWSPCSRFSILPFAESYTVIDLVSIYPEAAGVKVPFTWKVTGWFMVGWSAEFPARAVRYQEYIEHPALSAVDAKPYMAMRKWATQFCEVAPATPPGVPAPV